MAERSVKVTMSLHLTNKAFLDVLPDFDGEDQYGKYSRVVNGLLDELRAKQESRPDRQELLEALHGRMAEISKKTTTCPSRIVSGVTQ